MTRTGWWTLLLGLMISSPLQAQTSPAANEIKAKIWAAQLVQRNSAAALRHCSELNGTNFYFAQRDRVLNLQDYRRSRDNLAAQGGFNPEARRPWNKQDADARWAQRRGHRSGQLRHCREPARPRKEVEGSRAAAVRHIGRLRWQISCKPRARIWRNAHACVFDLPRRG